ncbi:NUDIX hydrolase [Chitinimonas lacunae]|uniref:NUDIX hydrolase n=1 Tax=Chitinimonas lacunae TaxID=1963018 RepID=A0ABV8MTG8_9NEIS
MLILPSDSSEARDWLARRLDSHRQPGGGDLSTEGETSPAAVLLPIVLRPGAPTLLLTRRNDRLSHHAGQISFPGGRIEFEETPEQAALRETWEEVGIAAEHIIPVGRLSPYVTISRFRITPVVGLVAPSFTLNLAPDEVAEAFEVPLSFVLERANYREHGVDLPGRRVVSHALDWQGRLIWGATAGMLMMFLRTVREESTE